MKEDVTAEPAVQQLKGADAAGCVFVKEITFLKECKIINFNC